MDAATQHKRNKLYNEINSGVFAAEQAARELARMAALQPWERDAARKISGELNGYNAKIGFIRRAQHLKINN